jgi:hypothetical protein
VSEPGDIERWHICRTCGATVKHTHQGDVEAERSRIAAFVRDKAEGTWDPNLEAVLRDVAHQIAGGGQS